MRARYRIEEQTSERVVIRDVGHDCCSVTNDVEAVVRDLFARGVLQRQALFYYDSEGQLDEIVVENGHFVCFAPGPR